MHSIILCTTNLSKVEEFSRILGRPVEHIKIELEEIQDLDAAAVCRKKVIQAYSKIHQPVCVDDSGLSLTSLGGFPGALVSHVLKAGGPALLTRLIQNSDSRNATAISVIGYADERGSKMFVGSLVGIISDVPRGTNGFGFDSVFVPAGTSRTLAELTAKEKDEISPRRKALIGLAQYLNME